MTGKMEQFFRTRLRAEGGANNTIEEGYYGGFDVADFPFLIHFIFAK